VSNNSLYGVGTPYQPLDFPTTLGSSDIKHSTSTMQGSQEKVLHQAAPYTQFDIQMQVISHLDFHETSSNMERFENVVFSFFAELFLLFIAKQNRHLETTLLACLEMP